jgi:peptidoglycan/LPS O-acetylase OafA/YrhL
MDNTAYSPGQVAVKVFMVLSGFLITLSLLKLDDDKVPGAWWRFTADRAARIFVAYYAILLVCYLLGIPVAWSNIFYYSNYTQTDPHFQHLWSLAVEEQFYVVWPIFFLVLPFSRKARYTLCWAIILTTLIWVAYECHVSTLRSALGERLFKHTEFNLILFALGGVLAFHVASTRNQSTFIKAFIIALAICAVARLITFPFGLSYRELYIDFIAVALISGLMVCVALYAKPSPRLIFWLAPIAWLGRISYGGYLWHYPIFHWWGITRDEYAGAAWPRFLIACALTIAAAALSYYGLEIWARKAVKHFTRYKKPQADPLPPTPPL